MNEQEVEQVFSKMRKAMEQLPKEGLSAIATAQVALDGLDEAVMIPLSRPDLQCCIAGVVLAGVTLAGFSLDPYQGGWPNADRFALEAGVDLSVAEDMISGYDQLFVADPDEEPAEFEGDDAIRACSRLTSIARELLESRGIFSS